MNYVEKIMESFSYPFPTIIRLGENENFSAKITHFVEQN